MPRQVATDSPHVSVIVLLYDEVDSVEPLHRELIGVLDGLGTSFEVVYIDDGSRDGSSEKLGVLAARDARVRVVSFRRNFGHAAAVQAGIDHSRGAILIFMDGDMQNDPHDIPHLLQKVDEGYDMVSGWRRDRRPNAIRLLASTIANWIIGSVTGVSLSDFGCTLKAYRREVIGGVKVHGEMHGRLLPAYASMVGARITELPVNHRPRTYGKSKRSLWRDSRVILDLISFRLLGGSSTRPMYTFGYAAIALWAAAAVVIAVAIVEWALWLSLLSVALVIVGVQLLVGGLLAELLVDSQQRPVYVVREVIERASHEKPAEVRQVS